MQLHSLYSSADSSAPRTLALGNFDGVHVGHRALLAEAVSRAKALGAVPAVLTFAPNPREYFAPESKPLSIMSLREKVEALRACGIEEIHVAKFNAALAAIPAENFAKDILAKHLNACHVVTGENFAFGHKRGGNVALLKSWLAEVGVGKSTVASEKDAHGVISSTRIRSLLTSGDVVGAAELLGAPYTISGHVMHGEKRGRTIGFPTLNLALEQRLRPRYGVYAATIMVDGAAHQGIANIGVKPSFGSFAPRLEAHSFDALPELYGARISVSLHRFIREEKKFENVQALIDQIGRDVLEVKA